MGLLLRDEVKAGDTELGFIIRETGVKARGMAEISQRDGGGGEGAPVWHDREES